MQCTTSLFFGPLVVLVYLTVEIIGGDQNVVEKLYSQMAKKVMTQLQMLEDDLNDGFTRSTNQISENNELLDSVKKYRKAYESSKDTKCEKHLVAAYLRDCEQSLPKDYIQVLQGKVKEVKDQVIEIDDPLREKCTSKSETCMASEKEAEVKLSGVFTNEKEKLLNDEAETVLTRYQRNMNACFKQQSADHVKQLNEGTKAMNECMEFLPQC